MRLGVSSYSFARSLGSGRMTILDVVDWVADSDADHLEIAAGQFGDDLPNDPDLVRAIRQRADERGVELADYVIGADFRGAVTPAHPSSSDAVAADTDATDAARIDSDAEAVAVPDVDGQIAHVKAHLAVAHELGITRFRHDVVAWAWRDADQAEFETVLAAIVPICRELADHAATLGITTMVENHGFTMNNSERIRRLVHAVDRPNFRTLLDVGNFLCVDEDPLQAVQLTLPMAAVVHLKDFHLRQAPPAPEGWLTTLAGRAILGTVVGYGDLPMPRIVDRIVSSGFDGPVSIEFEGLEDDLFAITTGFQNARRLIAEAEAEPEADADADAEAAMTAATAASTEREGTDA